MYVHRLQCYQILNFIIPPVIQHHTVNYLAIAVYTVYNNNFIDFKTQGSTDFFNITAFGCGAQYYKPNKCYKLPLCFEVYLHINHRHVLVPFAAAFTIKHQKM